MAFDDRLWGRARCHSVSCVSSFCCCVPFADRRWDTVWASFANSIGPGGISDIVITIISIVSFALGFFIGLFELGYAVGIATIALLGGFSIGVRIVLFRSDLLFHAYFGNWLVITGCGLVCFLLLLIKQRAAIVSTS